MAVRVELLPGGGMEPHDFERPPETPLEEVWHRRQAIRRQMAWVYAQQRELWDRMDGRKARPSADAAPAVPAAPDPGRDEPAVGRWPHIRAAAAFAGPAPAPLDEPARAEQAELDREVASSREEMATSEREWLRAEVRAMRRAGWAWEDLAEIGIGPGFLDRIGIDRDREPGG